MRASSPSANPSRAPTGRRRSRPRSRAKWSRVPAGTHKKASPCARAAAATTLCDPSPPAAPSASAPAHRVVDQPTQALTGLQDDHGDPQLAGPLDDPARIARPPPDRGLTKRTGCRSGAAAVDVGDIAGSSLAVASRIGSSLGGRFPAKSGAASWRLIIAGGVCRRRQPPDANLDLHEVAVRPAAAGQEHGLANGDRDRARGRPHLQVLARGERVGDVGQQFGGPPAGRRSSCSNSAMPVLRPRSH